MRLVVLVLIFSLGGCASLDQNQPFASIREATRVSCRAIVDVENFLKADADRANQGEM
jgi:hypothetical protein